MERFLFVAVVESATPLELEARLGLATVFVAASTVWEVSATGRVVLVVLPLPVFQSEAQAQFQKLSPRFRILSIEVPFSLCIRVPPSSAQTIAFCCSLN